MISRFFQNLLNFLKDAFEKLFELLASFGNWIIDAIQYVLSLISSAVISIWLHLIDFVLAFLPFVDMSDYSETIVTLRVYWSEWNNLLPLNTGLACVLTYLTLYMTAISVKLVVKMTGKVIDIVRG